MIGDFPGDDDIDIDRVLRGDRTERPKPRIAEVVSLRPKLNGKPQAKQITQSPSAAGFR